MIIDFHGHRPGLFHGLQRQHSADEIAKDLDEAGIDMIVMLHMDSNVERGDAFMGSSVEQGIWDYTELARQQPERIIPFAGIDPRRGKSGVELFERAVKEWGAKGLKLHPCLGFFPNDRMVYPLYEKAVELDVPVLIHTGIDPPPLRGLYANPIYLNDVCIDFPELRVVAAHMANVWRDELILLGYHHPNLYMDLSGVQADIEDKVALSVYRRLRQDLNVVGPKKLLFASDYPNVGAKNPYPGRKDISLRDWVNVFTEIPQEVREAGIEFTDEELSGILEDNAKHVLRL